MPKPRYLAPWHQQDLMAIITANSEGGGEGLDAEALANLKGKPAIYHCISRVVDRRFVFGELEKEQFVRYMRLYEQFCQVRVQAFCVMSNHFHILLEVPSRPEDGGQSWSDAKLLKHLKCLYSGPKYREIEWQLEHFRSQDNDRAAEELREKFFYRMWDLSEFMKTLKQRFTRWFNKHHGRRGTLWEERFKSTLVESGLAARTVAGYIDLNPVRAGIVAHAQAYRWCSFAEAVAGKQRAREGLQRVMYERALAASSKERAAQMLTDWRKVAGLYRKLLQVDLRRGEPDPEQAMKEAPRSGAAEALHHRVRFFADGLVIGTKRFVNEVFFLSRDQFGPHRKSGARKMRGIETELCSMRDLRQRPLG